MSTDTTASTAPSSIPQPRTFSVTPANIPSDIPTITALFNSYTLSLNIDLSFQDYSSELSSLPGKYSPTQSGALFLARNAVTGEAVGCIALRHLPSNSSGGRTCELKRLYITPSARGSGLGRRLTERMLDEAEELGYDEVKLDTLSSMVAAQRMYESLGFVDVQPYCFNPEEGVRFLGLRLPRKQNP